MGAVAVVLLEQLRVIIGTRPFCLVPTDIDLTVDEGGEVTGPIEAIVFAIAGCHQASDELKGSGVASVSGWR